MEKLRKKILDSVIYHWIVNIVLLSQHSVALKIHVSMNYQKKREIFKEMLFVKGFIALDEKLDKFFAIIRKAWFDSLIIRYLKVIYDAIVKYSFMGKLLSEFNIVYLIPLYIFIDKGVRTTGTSFIGIWDELFIIGLIFWLLFRRIILNKRYVFSAIDFPLIFFMLVYLALVFVESPELNIAVEGYRAVVQHMLWFFFALQLMESRKIIHRVVWIFIIGMALIGLHGTYQYVTGAPMLGNWVDSGEAVRTRAYSIVMSPNALGSLLVLFIPMGFAMFVANKDIISKIVALICTILMGLGMLFTLSRGAWFTAFIAIMIFFFFVGRRLIISFAVFVLAVLFNVESIWSRVSYMFSPEYSAKSAQGGRVYRYTTGIMEWSKSKLVGLGIGRYGGAVATNHNLSPFYMDSFYLKTLTESGIIGTSAYAIMIIATIWNLLGYLKAVKIKKDRIISYGIFAGLFGVLLHNFVENIFEVPFMVVYFWVCVAIIVAMSKVDKSL